jgi:DNA excision repair protein ERCC-4
MPASTIIVDPREQKPYCFTTVQTIRKKLAAGDYSILGYEQQIAVERKSLDDLVHTVVRDGGRFRRELSVLDTYRFACVVIEGSLHNVYAGHYNSQASPQSIVGLICRLMIDFPHVTWLFADKRPYAVEMTERLLLMASKSLETSDNDDSND